MKQSNSAPVTVLLAVALSCACAFAAAQDRYDRREREFGRSYQTRHWVFDNRHNHGHYYPVIGYTVGALPPGYLTIGFNRRRYFFQGGVWFEQAGPRFVVVRPPIGIVVPALPPAYTTVSVSGVPYYYADNVYYESAPGGYAVVNPPPSIEAAAPPAPAAPSPFSPGPPPASAPYPPVASAPSAPVSSGVWYYCESARAYYPYVAQCSEGWRQVPAAPPSAR